MSRIAICNSYEVILQEKNEKVNIMGDRRDLNPQPLVPQTSALPIELRPP